MREEQPIPPRRIDAVLLVLSLACASLYLLDGAGFVLDDHYYLRNAAFDGALHAAGDTGGDRPVGALVHIVLFGAIGPHPAPIILLLAAANGISAVLLHRLLRCWLPAGLAVVAAGLWVVLPLRTSLEAWMSTGTAVLAQLLALAALLLLARRAPRGLPVAAAGALLALATLSYESVVVLALPVGAWILIDRTGRIDGAAILRLAVAPLGALAWAFTHRLDGRHAVGGVRNPLPVLDANFARGIAPTQPLAAAVLVAAVVGTVLVVRAARQRAPGMRWTPPVAALVIGWVITWWGVVPYLTYFYSPYGAGDRLNILSAFGAVLVWAGLIGTLTDRRLRPAMLGALLLVGLATRVGTTDLWSRAGRDSARVAEAIVAAHPEPDRAILVGPRILVGNIAAFYDHSNIAAALQVAYDDRSIDAYLAYDLADLRRADAARFVVVDQRAVSTLDEARAIIDGAEPQAAAP